MFGVINGKDALGLMEDMAILNTNRQMLESQSRGQQQARQEHISAQEHANAAMVGAAVAIKVRDNKLQEMDARLRDTNESLKSAISGWYGDVAASGAGTEVLTIAVREIARLSGKNEKDLKVLMDTIRSREYDKRVEGFMQEGNILTDPRKDTNRCPSWYIPDSCV